MASIRLMLVALVIAALTACTAMTANNRIETSVTAFEFNSLNSTFMERPTFANITEFSNDSRSLVLSMDNYGSRYSAAYFDSRHIDDYVGAIEKFLKWEEIARERSDLISKEIAMIPGGGSLADQKYRFTFHSGNTRLHYLSITHCTAVMCVEQSTLNFDVTNAKRLIDLLREYQSGEFDVSKTDSPYE